MTLRVSANREPWKRDRRGRIYGSGRRIAKRGRILGTLATIITEARARCQATTMAWAVTFCETGMGPIYLEER